MPGNLRELREAWLRLWPDALGVWSGFARLSEPRWCIDSRESEKEGMGGNFAMIRLIDHSVVISLSDVVKRHLENFAVEIMAHEIGHHIYCPSDLTDLGFMIARIRQGLPEKEDHASLVSNLYSDLLINDRLQRRFCVNIAGVYQALKDKDGGPLWNFYMRIYEILWSLHSGTLTDSDVDQVMEADARLGARLVRFYARDWIDGAGSFAALCYIYLPDGQGAGSPVQTKGWLDTGNAGEGGEPSGLTGMDDGEMEAPVHPSMDRNLAGMDDMDPGEKGEDEKAGSRRGGKAEKGGIKSRKNFRGVSEYGTLLRAMRKDLTDHDIALRYYKERALPYLVRFPEKKIGEKSDPLPEGLETWDIGMPMEDVSWFDSIMVSPRPVPGITTVQRVYGDSPGSTPSRVPLDLYIGIDCSGSMPNPQYTLSYPVLAGVIMALSALRAGARVMVVLSGEPGSSMSTEGFERSEYEILKVLTGYLGTGYAFGIRRLAKTFFKRRKGDNPVHIIVITDSDIFSMLEEKSDDIRSDTYKTNDGWDVARISLANAAGGGTYVLHSPYSTDSKNMKRMNDEGWNVYTISTWEDIIIFASEFSRRNYE